jgi:hypothetical protein
MIKLLLISLWLCLYTTVDYDTVYNYYLDYASNHNLEMDGKF